ncbi:hypothetical protein NPIL_443881 [Nephila pilipes]|uniref:Uncharacterized protein n=1 Tax=Nephila pilipes TaxID=299642 RepID=A0A8X6T4C3_NEPPI|nr:hypothetical protein NPIL_443881 [Nephila pilipes]
MARMNKISIISSKNKYDKIDTLISTKMLDVEEDIISKYDFYDEDLLSRNLKASKKLKKKNAPSIDSRSKRVPLAYDSSSRDGLKTKENKKSTKVIDLLKKSEVKKESDDLNLPEKFQNMPTKPLQNDIKDINGKNGKPKLEEISKNNFFYKNKASNITVREKEKTKNARGYMILCDPETKNQAKNIKNVDTNCNIVKRKENENTDELKSELRSSKNAKSRQSHLKSPVAKRANLKNFTMEQNGSDDNYGYKEKSKSKQHTGAQFENAGKDKEYNTLNEVETKQTNGKFLKKRNAQTKPEINIRHSERIAKRQVVNYKV